MEHVVYCFALMAFMVALTTTMRPVMAMTESPRCKMRVRAFRMPTRRFVFSCVCGASNSTGLQLVIGKKFVRGRQCLWPCLRSLEGKSCRSPFSWPMISSMKRCCVKCGGIMNFRNSFKRTRSLICSRAPIRFGSSPSPRPQTPDALLRLAPVDRALSPDRNGLVLQRNMRAIVTDPRNQDFVNIFPSVSGVTFISDRAFNATNSGNYSSLADILKTPSFPTDNNGNPPLPSRLLQKRQLRVVALDGVVRGSYNCHANQCGAQVTIYSKQDIRPVVIGRAINKLKNHTPNFYTVFVTNYNRIRVINENGRRYAVLIPYKDSYLENF